MTNSLGSLGWKTFFLWLVLLIPGIVGFLKGQGFNDLYKNYWGQLLPSANLHVTEAVVLIFIFVPVFLLYWRAIKISRRSRLVEVTAWTTLFTVTLMLLFPFACDDIYYYIASGQLQATYEMNPYFKTAHQVSHWSMDPFLRTTGWGFLLSPYGPIWNMTSSLLVVSANDQFWLAVGLFKAFAGLLHMINFFLIGFIAKQLDLHPSQAMTIYGWNPLILFELPGHAHNDVLLLLFLIIAFVCLATKWKLLALPFLTLSAMVKYTSVLLGPLIMLWLLHKKKYLPLVFGTFLSILLIPLVWIPYWNGLDTLEGLFRQINFYSIKSLHYLLLNSLPQWFPHMLKTQAFLLSSWVMLVLFGITYFLLLFFLWRQKKQLDIIGLARFGCIAFLLYLFFVNKWFQPWYFSWMIPLVALTRWPCAISLTALLLSCTAELSRVPQLLFENNGFLVQVLTVIIIWLPLVTYRQIKNF
ncbi:hypothetical protein Dred_1899 [Desulforamulus reducens MI-1]|uniref:DUF2029 domain-containing protein n=1 Tax=Desulforamulus reducens (strain ATCC BAA-1160 / DSM 100696 / MI-1) TaxID=349161 RepID=A4J5R7_DESRM|nr:hypothetical protein Dred_1899 [Desulforamulus reducens MI-1]